MSKKRKSQAAILQKLGIKALNPMQLAAQAAVETDTEIVLLSPTGSGKTLAFLLPLLEKLDPNLEQVQMLILVPSRELALQIEQVARDMGSGYKINAVYGGRPIVKDKDDLQHPPAILIGTPGRVADHFRRGTVSTKYIRLLVLDEFDKSLETGFEKEMKAIVNGLPRLQIKVLTSATEKVAIPDFVGLAEPTRIDFLSEQRPALQFRTVVADRGDKPQALLALLAHLGTKRGILFCNFKETLQQLHDFLRENKVPHSQFFGGMDQQDRERALVQFRNGSHRLLLATDLAARGLDVPSLDFIIHYQLPMRAEEFVHRNGRTARMQEDGTAYLIRKPGEPLSPFVGDAPLLTPNTRAMPAPPPWSTLFISGGRKDKISKGDIAGLFMKKGGLKKEELGLIELKQDCAFAAVPRTQAAQLVKRLNNQRVKKRKVRIYGVG